MRIVERYSHLNGWEHIMVHKPQVWHEIEEVIAIINAEEIRTKVSKEKTKAGRMLYSPGHLNQRFKEEFFDPGLA